MNNGGLTHVPQLRTGLLHYTPSHFSSTFLQVLGNRSDCRREAPAAGVYDLTRLLSVEVDYSYLVVT